MPIMPCLMPHQSNILCCAQREVAAREAAEQKQTEFEAQIRELQEQMAKNQQRQYRVAFTDVVMIYCYYCRVGGRPGDNCAARGDDTTVAGGSRRAARQGARAPGNAPPSAGGARHVSSGAREAAGGDRRQGASGGHHSTRSRLQERAGTTLNCLIPRELHRQIALQVEKLRRDADEARMRQQEASQAIINASSMVNT